MSRARLIDLVLVVIVWAFALIITGFAARAMWELVTLGWSLL